MASQATDEHKAKAPPTSSIRLALVTASDSRTPATNVGGQLLRRLVDEAGFAVVEELLLAEDPAALDCRGHPSRISRVFRDDGPKRGRRRRRLPCFVTAAVKLCERLNAHVSPPLTARFTLLLAPPCSPVATRIGWTRAQACARIKP